EGRSGREVVRCLPAQLRLPDLTRVDFQRRQPAPSVAERVDALHAAQIQNLAARLRRVADDGNLAHRCLLLVVPRSPFSWNTWGGWPRGHCYCETGET